MTFAGRLFRLPLQGENFLHLALVMIPALFLSPEANALMVSRLLLPSEATAAHVTTETLQFGWEMMGPISLPQSFQNQKLGGVLDAGFAFPLRAVFGATENTVLFFNNKVHRWRTMEYSTDWVKTPQPIPKTPMPECSVLYARTSVQNTAQLTNVHVEFGSDDYLTIWIDGEEVGYYNQVPRAFHRNQSRTDSFSLSPGVHRILVKLVNVTAKSGFGLEFKHGEADTILVEVPQEIVKRTIAKPRNALPNSSFEVGLSDWEVQSNNKDFHATALKRSDSPHGEYALVVTLPPDDKAPSRIRIRGKWTKLNPRLGPYELSVWARSATPGAQIGLSLCNAIDHELLERFHIGPWKETRRYELSPEWRRYTVTSWLEPSYLDSYRGVIRIEGHGAVAELDAASLHLGSREEEYSPAESLAIGMGTQSITNLFAYGDIVMPFASLYCPDSVRRPSGLEMTITNGDLQRIRRDTWTLRWSKTGHARVQSAMENLPLGLYRVKIAVRNCPKGCPTERSFRFAVLSSRLEDMPDPDSPFGIHTDQELPAETVQGMKRMGAKAWRLVNFPDWSTVERQKQASEWTRDTRIDGAEQMGLSVLANPSQCPAWARRAPSRFFNYRRTRIPPQDFGLFARLCSEAVRHYGDRALQWEIWNEPDTATHWDGTPEEYAELLCRSYASIKEVAPDILVLGGSVSSLEGEGWDWLTRAIDSGMLECLDALALHGYRRLGPETWEQDLCHLREEIQGRGLPAPGLVITEFGYQGLDTIDGTLPYFPRFPENGLNEREQAALLVRSYVITLAAGVRQLYWYKWDEARGDNVGPDVHGLLRVMPVLQPKPALVAYNVTATLLRNAKNGRRITHEDPHVHIYEFERDDANVWVAWRSDKEAHSDSLPVGEVSRVRITRFLYGTETKHTTDGKVDLLLKNEPIFVIATPPKSDSIGASIRTSR